MFLPGGRKRIGADARASCDDTSMRSAPSDLHALPPVAENRPNLIPALRALGPARAGSSESIFDRHGRAILARGGLYVPE